MYQVDNLLSLLISTYILPGVREKVGEPQEEEERLTIDIMHSPSPWVPIPNLICPSSYRRQMTFRLWREDIT
jgi:hypothetical protein